jgi:hypothetical protein
MDVDFPTEGLVAPDLSTQAQSYEEKEDDVEDIFLGPPLPKPKPKPARKLVPKREFPWLAWGRRKIAHRNEDLNVPFSKVSDEVWRHLEKAEKTKGRLQRVLTELKQIGHKAAEKEVAKMFESDNEDEEGVPGVGAGSEDDESVLECVRRILVTEAAIQQAMLRKKQKAKSKRQTRNLALIPPGGVLGTIGVLGEVVLPVDLRIEEYSNEDYWRFAPYLDSVRRILESPTPVSAVLTSSARTSEPNLKSCMNPMIKGFIVCRFKVSKSSMKVSRKK